MVIEDTYMEEAVSKSITEIFETMIFMDVEPVEGEVAPFPSEDTIISTIGFSGNINGSVSILCNQSLAKTITMNMLVMDDESELSETDVADTMGEVANMTMGSLKANLYDHAGELSVSIPSVISGDNIENKLGEVDKKISQVVCVDGTFNLQVVVVCKE